MQHHRLRTIAFLAVGIFSSRGLAQSAISDALTLRIDSVFSRYNASTPGCAVGVFQNGKIAMSKGYGLASVEFGAPITPRTPFIMGSVSKQFTAAAIALLVEQGRISLTDDIRKYVPELHDYGKRVTIDHLVHHTSGIRDWWALVDAAGMRPDDGYTVDDVLALAARQRHLNFDPGAEYNYSNTGYILLGIVVKRVTGKTLRQFAAEQIFTPLGMSSSHFHDDHNEPVRGRASAYSPLPGGAWTINVWNNDIVGQGGVMTTIEDLQKWDENFYTGTVGGKGFLARQLQRGKLNNDSTITYAFGLQVESYRGLPMVEHSGSTGRISHRHRALSVGAHERRHDVQRQQRRRRRLAHRVADIVLADKFTQPVPAAGDASGNPTGRRRDRADAGRGGRDGRAILLRRAERDVRAVAGWNEAGASPAARGADTLRAVDHQTLRGAGHHDPISATSWRRYAPLTLRWTTGGHADWSSVEPCGNSSMVCALAF